MSGSKKRSGVAVRLGSGQAAPSRRVRQRAAA